MGKVDLHIHSVYSSDGEFEIKDVVDKCVEREVDLFSISDHNSVKGVGEALVVAGEKGVSCVPGIEIDCHFHGTDLHLLGYNINWESRDFEVLEESIAKKVMSSFAAMVDNLDRLGIQVDCAEVLKRANGKLPTGELIAEVLLSDRKYESSMLKPYMKGGERSDMPYINFYLDFFAQGKPAYVKIDYMEYKDAVELVMDNGGVPVVAHPGLNFRGKEEVVEKLLDGGARGLEVFNNYHDVKQMNYFARLVQQRKILMTCGSDFHGKTKPLIQVGHYKREERYSDYLAQSVAFLKNVPA